VVVDDEIVFVFDERPIHVRGPVHRISAIPNAALTRTIRPTSNESPISR
jgi:hypothetical protein